MVLTKRDRLAPEDRDRLIELLRQINVIVNEVTVEMGMIDRGIPLAPDSEELHSERRKKLDGLIDESRSIIRRYQ